MAKSLAKPKAMRRTACLESARCLNYFRLAVLSIPTLCTNSGRLCRSNFLNLTDQTNFLPPICRALTSS